MTRAALLVAMALMVVPLAACSGSRSGTDGREGLHSTVPNVVGLDFSSAEDALEEAGYETGVVTTRTAEAAPPGTVVRQSPPAGTSVSRESAVDLVMSSPSD